MNIVDVLGYLGGLLVFSTFYLKMMTRLRTVAIASNVVFIAYGYLGGLWPVLLLHTLMLPLNLWRLTELREGASIHNRPHRANRLTTCHRAMRVVKTDRIRPAMSFAAPHRSSART